MGIESIKSRGPVRDLNSVASTCIHLEGGREKKWCVKALAMCAINSAIEYVPRELYNRLPHTQTSQFGIQKAACSTLYQ